MNNHEENCGESVNSEYTVSESHGSFCPYLFILTDCSALRLQNNRLLKVKCNVR